jgi:hypothetical protein
VRRLVELCRSGGITLLPRERERVGPAVVAQVLGRAGD